MDGKSATGTDTTLAGAGPVYTEVATDRLVWPSTRRLARPAAIRPELLERVRRYGPLVAIPVRPRADGRYEVLAAESTWRVCQVLRLPRVPVRLLESIDADDVERMLAAEGRADPISEAEALAARLASLQATHGRGAQTALARTIERSPGYVSHALRLLELPADVRKAVRVGLLSAGHAKALLALEDADDRRAFALQAIDKRWTVRETEAAIRGERGSNRADIARFERRLGEQLGCAVRVDERRGRLTIAYGTLEVLDGLLERIGYRDTD